MKSEYLANIWSVAHVVTLCKFSAAHTPQRLNFINATFSTYFHT